MNRLSFFEDIDEKGMHRLVVKELKNYKALKETRMFINKYVKDCPEWLNVNGYDKAE
ncbi:hypothetical protein [Bacillus wiedmannii]|uniref:hypothetical protein n=1 Tax=Bacillus wiedmannii TaxID=1890302 RepID=UPI00217E89B1